MNVPLRRKNGEPRWLEYKDYHYFVYLALPKSLGRNTTGCWSLLVDVRAREINNPTKGIAV